MNSDMITRHSKFMKSLSPDCRIWIYQSSRPFTEVEVESIGNYSSAFVKEWQAHGSNLTADYAIYFNRFIILFVDETSQNATGCSIDKSVRFIQNLEKEFGLSLMERTEVAYFDTHENLATMPLADMGKAAEAGVISGDTLVFNNTIGSNKDLESNWIVKISDSWHARFI